MAHFHQRLFLVPQPEMQGFLRSSSSGILPAGRSTTTQFLSLASLAVSAAVGSIAVYQAYREYRRSSTPSPSTPLPPSHTVHTLSADVTIAPLPDAPAASTSKRVIAVDLDEVLGEFVPQLLQYHNAHYGTSLRLSDFHSYQFMDVWGGTRDEAVAKVYHFFTTPYFLSMPPIPAAYDTLHDLSHRFTYHIVTARQHFIEPQTRTWIAQHYPHTFTSLLFGNHYGQSGAARTKAEMCQEIGASVLIDDSADHARSVSGVVDWVLLFDRDGTYMWNKGRKEYDEDMPANVKRIHSWAEIRAFLEQLPAP